jgi:hypothetical protein
MRFQDAARDGRAVVYARIQADPLVARATDALGHASFAGRVMARAVMNGESTEPTTWMTMFPTLFGLEVAAEDRRAAEAVLAVALEVADRGEQVRSQFRGAIVEALTARLLSRRTGESAVRRERRIMFDGVRAEIHPYDVTVERDESPEAWDCKWGARGIGEDVLHQLDDARAHASDEDVELRVGLVVFDAERSCGLRVSRVNAPQDRIDIVSIETLDRLGGAVP